jgi:hypothetical protein
MPSRARARISAKTSADFEVLYENISIVSAAYEAVESAIAELPK